MNSILVNADAKFYLTTIADQSCDVVFLDPPYGIKSSKHIKDLHRPEGGQYVGVPDSWDAEFSSRQLHLQFIDWYVSEAKRICKPTGTVWIMGTYHNIHDVGHAMLNQDYFILNDISWVKRNPTPQFRGVRFNNSIETILWTCPHGKQKYYFDYQAMKAYNGGKQMRADWFIPVCRGSERVKDLEGNILHPTQKPLDLLKRVVLASVPPDGTIIDFMSGSGTTGVAATLYNRNFTLIERDKRYCDASNARLLGSGAVFDYLTF